VAADVFIYIALPDGGLETALHTVGCNGPGGILGGKKPFAGPVWMEKRPLIFLNLNLTMSWNIRTRSHGCGRTK
jgi:hypothetical protein